MKFDAVKLSHLVDAEYGNQGIDFKMIPREGFGWMNGPSLSSLLSPLPLTSYSPPSHKQTAAYQVGLSFLTNHMRRAVAACTSPEVFFGRTMMLAAPGVGGAERDGPAPAGDPLGLAMESMSLGAAAAAGGGGGGVGTPPPVYTSSGGVGY